MKLLNYAIRIEFQARGSPHAHCVIWVKDAPEFGVDNSDDVCDFIDQYVSCKVPAEDGKLKDIVLLLQKHKHSSYCRRNKTCRFSFPKPPSSKTIITKDDPERGDNNQELFVLRKVQKLIADSNTDLSLAELLDKAEVTKKIISFCTLQRFTHQQWAADRSSLATLLNEPKINCFYLAPLGQLF